MLLVTFFHCCDPIPEKKQLRDLGLFWMIVLEGIVQPGGEGMGVEVVGSCSHCVRKHVVYVDRKQKSIRTGAHSTFSRAGESCKDTDQREVVSSTGHLAHK